LQGKALTIEDAADVLTLKDNEETVEDFATALQLVSRATVSSCDYNLYV
jgi:nuclear pore complex protein Nup133